MREARPKGHKTRCFSRFQLRSADVVFLRITAAEVKKRCAHSEVRLGFRDGRALLHESSHWSQTCASAYHDNRRGWIDGQTELYVSGSDVGVDFAADRHVGEVCGSDAVKARGVVVRRWCIENIVEDTNGVWRGRQRRRCD